MILDMGKNNSSKSVSQDEPDLKAIRARLRLKDEEQKGAFEEKHRKAVLVHTTRLALEKLCWGKGEKVVPEWYVNRIRVPSEIWGPTWHEVAKAWGNYPGFDHLPVAPKDAGEGVKLGKKLFLFAQNHDPKSTAKMLASYRKALGRGEDVPPYSKRTNEDTENGIWCFARQLYATFESLEQESRPGKSSVDTTRAAQTSEAVQAQPPQLAPLKDEVQFDPTDLAILKWLKKQNQRFKTSHIAIGAGLNPGSIGDNLAKLRRLELIENPGRSGYLITPKGLSYLEAHTRSLSSQVKA